MALSHGISGLPTTVRVVVGFFQAQLSSHHNASADSDRISELSSRTQITHVNVIEYIEKVAEAPTYIPAHSG